MTSQQRTPTRSSKSNGNCLTVPWKRVVDAIVRKRSAVPPDRSVLVGVSGIDGSGKGFVTVKMADALRDESLNVAVISADDWLNLPGVCFNRGNHAEHFYQHAIRFDEMFERLILPLRKHRGVDVLADCGDAKATVHANIATFCGTSTSLCSKEFFCLRQPIVTISISRFGLNVHSKPR